MNADMGTAGEDEVPWTHLDPQHCTPFSRASPTSMSKSMASI